jgi:hypothetical protein
MPFKASDMKVMIRTKEIISLLVFLNIWKIHLCSIDSYLVIFWAVTHVRIHWIHYRKTFPYFELQRLEEVTHFNLKKQ